jgi:hypothetical protein
MKRIGVLALLTLLGWSCAPTFARPPAQGKPAEPRTYYVVLWLPRFDGIKAGEQFSPTFEEVEAVLKGAPCLPKGVKAYGDLNQKRMVQFDLLPTADSDLGDVAKALGKLGGDKKKPLAVVNLALATPLEEKQFAALKKELERAKGIDWDRSDRSGLALDEAGGAKFMEFLAAYKKAGVVLQTGLDDK